MTLTPILCTLASLALAASASAQVTIQEVLYNPIGADSGAEHIELHNPTNSKIVLDCWALFLDNPSTFGKAIYTFEAGRTLGPGGYLVLHWLAAGNGDIDDLYTESEGQWFFGSGEEIANDGFGLSLFEDTINCDYGGPEFGDPSLIRDFMQAGTGIAAHSQVAIDAGIWTRRDEVLLRSEGWSLVYEGTGNASSDWFALPGGFVPGDNGLVLKPAHNYGSSCSGSGGFSPTIPDVDSVPGAADVHFQLSLTQALSPGFAFVIVGLAPASIPFGTDCFLWVIPEFLVSIPTKNIGQGNGTIQIPAYNPLPDSGIDIYVCYLCADASESKGATISNAMTFEL